MAADVAVAVVVEFLKMQYRCFRCCRCDDDDDDDVDDQFRF
jgi:hypothetical protein